MSQRNVAAWQLPPGVSPGTWDYVQKASIADDYDPYFDSCKMFALDMELVRRHLPRPEPGSAPIVADLGCGTGRALVELAKDGFSGLAIDLSGPMLDVVRRKAQEQELPITVVRANLVQLECLADSSVDHAISLFSTLGMIQGRASRIKSLHHANRILRKGGCFVVHVHNLWSGLRDPGGLNWLARSWWQSHRTDLDWGDRVYQYRGLPNMFLHNYRRRELRADLHAAGFHVEHIYPIDRTATRVLRCSKLVPQLRAGGYIAICRN